MNARAWAAVATLAAAAVAAIDTRPGAPAVAQRATPIGSPTVIGPATPRPLGECGVVASLSVEPRVLEADDTATVTLRAAFDLPRRAIPDRVAIVVGPIGVDLAPTVSDELTALVAMLELDRGHAVAILPVGGPGEPVVWRSGPGAAEAARAALAAPPLGAATMADWRTAVIAAADALASSPPTLKTALLVVGDHVPVDLDATLDWLPVGQRLVDALVQNVVVNLDPSSWLSLLAVGPRGRLFRLNAATRAPVHAAIVLRDGRRSIVPLNAVWHYEHDLGTERWRAFALAPETTRVLRFTDAEVVATDLVGSWSGTLTFRYGARLHSAVNFGASREMLLADGTHAFTFTADVVRTCRLAFDPIALCVHRRGRADACAPFAAALTATAAASPTVTVTGTSSPTPPAPPTPTATPSATPALPGSPTRTPTAPSPATTTPPSTEAPPSATPAGWRAPLWLPWTLRAPASGAAGGGSGASTAAAGGG